MSTNGAALHGERATGSGGPVAPEERAERASRSPEEIAGGLVERFAERAAAHDRDASFPVENYEELRTSGLIRMAIPGELGGYDASLLDTVRVLETLGRGCSSTALAFAMHLSATGQLSHLWRIEGTWPWGSWLSRIAGEELAIGGTLSEAKSWNAVIFPQSTAERVPGGYEVTGDRTFCTGSATLDLIQCTARARSRDDGDCGLYFFVSPGLPGLDFKGDWDTLGMRGSASQGVRLRRVFVPDEWLLYRYEYGTADLSQLWLSFLTWSFLGFASVYSGIAAAARDRAIELVKGRSRAPGTHSLAHKPTTQLRTAEMDVGLATMHAIREDVARRYPNGELVPLQAVVDAAMAKYVCVTEAIRVVDRAMAIVGGQAYFRKLPLERLWRDVRAGPFHPFSAEDSLEMLGKFSLGLDFLSPSGWAL